MKTNLLTPKNFQRWERFLKPLWLRSLSVQVALLLAQPKTEECSEKKIWLSLKSSKLAQQFLALVVRVGAYLASIRLSWRVILRFLIGIFFFAVLAPMADTAYTWLFDKNNRVPMDVWYYQSYFWLFLCLGPFIDKIFTWIGAYFIFVHAPNKFKSYLLAYPIGLAIAKIIWLLQVNCVEEFDAIPTWPFYMVGFSLAAYVILVIEYLVWFKFHRVDAIAPKEEGLKQIAYKLNPEEFRESVIKVWDFKSRVKQLNA